MLDFVPSYTTMSTFTVRNEMCRVTVSFEAILPLVHSFLCGIISFGPLVLDYSYRWKIVNSSLFSLLSEVKTTPSGRHPAGCAVDREKCYVCQGNLLNPFLQIVIHSHGPLSSKA